MIEPPARMVVPSALVMRMGVGSSMGWRRFVRALMTEREPPESSMKDAMIEALEGSVAGSSVVIAVRGFHVAIYRIEVTLVWWRS